MLGWDLWRSLDQLPGNSDHDLDVDPDSEWAEVQRNKALGEQVGREITFHFSVAPEEEKNKKDDSAEENMAR